MNWKSPLREIEAGFFAELNQGENMAGPTGSVLLPQALTDSQWEQFEMTLRDVSIKFETDEGRGLHFQVGDTQRLGGSYCDTTYGRPFGLAIESADTYTEIEILFLIEESFGFLPEQELIFYAMSKSDEDHKILGVLLLHFARLFGGVVDFGGALLPPLPPKMYDKGWLWHAANWPDIAPYFAEMIKGMKGNIISVPYQVNQTRVWAHHVSDVDFMESWLHHPDFHMIK